MMNDEGSERIPTRGTPCAACKLQRRKCTEQCVFAPYFPAETVQTFACVHHVFGATNVRNMLRALNPSMRAYAVRTLSYQAAARVRDPVHGCMGFITELEQKLERVKIEIMKAKQELLKYVSPEAMKELLSGSGPNFDPFYTDDYMDIPVLVGGNTLTMPQLDPQQQQQFLQDFNLFKSGFNLFHVPPILPTYQNEDPAKLAPSS